MIHLVPERSRSQYRSVVSAPLNDLAGIILASEAVGWLIEAIGWQIEAVGWLIEAVGWLNEAVGWLSEAEAKM
ncbi:MAG: hypothetical protein H7329_05805 [Opitutaceae bacterium]|nr:hypothetical protein [Cytophagales bacterium]